MKQYERYSVWSKHCITGERHWISYFDNLQKAIHEVYQCYEDDRMHGSVGEYYYYIQDEPLLGLDSDTFYIYHVAAVMVDNLRRLLLGINLSDKAIMDFDFPGVGFPV